MNKLSLVKDLKYFHKNVNSIELISIKAIKFQKQISRQLNRISKNAERIGATKNSLFLLLIFESNELEEVSLFF